MINNAKEIQLRAERKFGEISRDMEKMSGARTDLVTDSYEVVETKKDKLDSVGVSKFLAHTFEKVADMPEETFEQKKRAKLMALVVLLERTSIITFIFIL